MPGAVNVKIAWTRPGGGAAPTITSPAFLVAGTVDTLYPTTAFTATGTAPITWSITAGTLPAGMAFSSAGVLSGTPTATASGSITFTATNAYGSANTSLALTVNAAGALAPTVVTTGLPDVTAHKNISIPLEASGLLPISWSISGGTAPNRAAKQTTWTGGGLPAGLTLDQFTGQIRGRSSAPFTGASFTVVATNSAGSANQPLSLNALDVSSGSPSFVTSVLARGKVGVNYEGFDYGSRYIYVNGKTPITYSIVSGLGSLPPGVTLSALGVLSGTATTAGTYPFTVRATNSLNSADSAFSIEVVASSSKLPVILNGKIPDAVINSEVLWHRQMMLAEFSVSASSFATTNGSNVVVVTQPLHPYLTGESVQISGVYGNPFNGVSPSNLNGHFTVTYINANSFSVVIAVNATATGSGGSDFKTKLTPTWSAVANANPFRAIPAGVSINSSTGLVSGTVTASAGEYRFLIQAVNSSGTDQAEIAMTVSPVPTAPSTNLYRPTVNVWNELSS